MKNAVRYCKRSVTVDFVALKRELETGTLVERDRQTAERMVPGICDFVTGKIDRLPCAVSSANRIARKSEHEQDELENEL
jgi:hypothetical protein